MLWVRCPVSGPKQSPGGRCTPTKSPGSGDTQAGPSPPPPAMLVTPRGLRFVLFPVYTARLACGRVSCGSCSEGPAPDTAPVRQGGGSSFTIPPRQPHPSHRETLSWGSSGGAVFGGNVLGGGYNAHLGFCWAGFGSESVLQDVSANLQTPEATSQTT